MNIPAFLVYCAIMAVTPGPNNLMSLYLGASGGSRFWRFFAGSMAGLFVKCALCGLLNVLLAEKIPALVPYLKWLGALYMLYLAFGMVRSGLKPAGDDQRSGEGSFQSGILLQVLNVKSWVAALSIFSVYIIPFTTAVGAMLLAALAFTLFCALASLLWFGCGAAIQRLYRRFRLNRPPKVGVQHCPRQVDNRTQRALRFPFQPGAGLLRPVVAPCRKRLCVANRFPGFVEHMAKQVNHPGVTMGLTQG